MLASKKVRKVIALLGQGLSKSETARIAGVSRPSVYKIERDISRKPLAARCAECGQLVFPPCRRCALQAPQERSAVPSLPPIGAASVAGTNAGNTFSPPLLFELELKEEHRQRYEAIRRKVAAEIADGLESEREKTLQNDAAEVAIEVFPP